jgi:beta-N-acetylhexosaminidase
MTISAAIFGCSAKGLTPEEKSFFREADPLGFILFARNVESPDQMRRLTAELREAVGRDDAPILIDQEGGRVARLRPPHWRVVPAAARFGELALRDRAAGVEAARLNGSLLAAELRSIGVTVDCVPVLDLRFPGAHEVIGERAFSADPRMVTRLGRATAEGLLAGGVMPVIKHMPGHGRAEVDSHLSLPVVTASRETLEETDFRPFRSLRKMPWAISAHVVYTAIDPDRPATTSPKVIEEIIRGSIGFDGVLVSDDLSMQALAGAIAERARDVFRAGCDLVLHCNGKMEEMEAVAGETPALEGLSAERIARAAKRLARAPKRIGPSATAGTGEMAERLAELLGIPGEVHA